MGLCVGGGGGGGLCFDRVGACCSHHSWLYELIHCVYSALYLAVSPQLTQPYQGQTECVLVDTVYGLAQ